MGLDADTGAGLAAELPAESELEVMFAAGMSLEALTRAGAGSGADEITGDGMRLGLLAGVGAVSEAKTAEGRSPGVIAGPEAN